MPSWSGNPLTFGGSGLSFTFDHPHADLISPVTCGGMSARGEIYAQTNEMNVSWARAPASRETTSLSTWATHGNLSIEESDQSDHEGQPKRSFQGIDFFAASAEGVAARKEANAEDVESFLRDLQLSSSEKNDDWKTEEQVHPGDDEKRRNKDFVETNQKWEKYKMTLDSKGGPDSQKKEAKPWNDITRKAWCELAWQTSPSGVNVGGERSLGEMMKTSPNFCVSSKRHWGCGKKMPVTLTGGTFGVQGAQKNEVVFRRQEEGGLPKRKRVELNHICHIIDL